MSLRVIRFFVNSVDQYSGVHVVERKLTICPSGYPLWRAPFGIDECVYGLEIPLPPVTRLR